MQRRWKLPHKGHRCPCSIYIKRSWIVHSTLVLELLQHNTSTGPFQKLGRLYESCLRQSINSSYVKFKMLEIGSYMPATVTGPATVGGLILKLNEFGPPPLVSYYFDLSYGRKPQPMLIIDSSFESAPLLQKPIRWTAPKAAPFEIKFDIPPLLDSLIDIFLPASLDADKRDFERESIVNFVRELTQLRRESFRKGFSDSHVLYNVSALNTLYPFVSDYYYTKQIDRWNKLTFSHIHIHNSSTGRIWLYHQIIRDQFSSKAAATWEMWNSYWNNQHALLTMH